MTFKADLAAMPDPRRVIGVAMGVAVTGGASPQSVEVPWPADQPRLPANYEVRVMELSMEARARVTSRTATGFAVTLDNGGMISAGTIGCLVIEGENT